MCNTVASPSLSWFFSNIHPTDPFLLHLLQRQTTVSFTPRPQLSVPNRGLLNLYFQLPLRIQAQLTAPCWPLLLHDPPLNSSLFPQTEFPGSLVTVSGGQEYTLTPSSSRVPYSMPGTSCNPSNGSVRKELRPAFLLLEKKKKIRRGRNQNLRLSEPRLCLRAACLSPEPRDQRCGGRREARSAGSWGGGRRVSPAQSPSSPRPVLRGHPTRSEEKLRRKSDG